MADCITTYQTCMETLYDDYKSALNINPAEADRLTRKINQANIINALYWSADAAANESEKVIQCTRIRALFTGDVCLASGALGASAAVDSGFFTAATLDGSYDLTITHILNTTLIASAVAIDPSGTMEVALPVVISDVNTVVLSFGGPIATGQWTWIITAQPTI